MAHLVMVEDIEVAEEEEASLFWSNFYLFVGCFEVYKSSDEGTMAVVGLSGQP